MVVSGPRMDWNVPLVVAALVFLSFLVWRMRPALSSSRVPRPKRGALREAKKKIEGARTPAERALALADAGDVCAAIGRATGATGYYLRAMRSDPASAAIVDRAARGLVRRPYTLESLLWRRLGAEAWEGASRPGAVAALRHLAALYAGPVRHTPRARALTHALAALGEPTEKEVVTEPQQSGGSS